MTDQELADGLKTIIFTDGWQNVVKPGLQKLESRASSRLIAAPDERARDQIIGELRMVKWMLSWERQYVEAAKRFAEAQEEELASEPALTTFNNGVV